MTAKISFLKIHFMDPMDGMKPDGYIIGPNWVLIDLHDNLRCQWYRSFQSNWVWVSEEANILTMLWTNIFLVYIGVMVKSKMQILTSFFPLKNQIRSAFSIKNAIFEGSGTINSVIIAQKSCFFEENCSIFTFCYKNMHFALV